MLRRTGTSQSPFDMTQEILKQNQLIAEFMGYEKSSEDHDFTFYTHPDGKGIVIQSEHDYQKFDTHELMEARGFRFHRSWNWLMPVVEKIESLGHGVTIYRSGCQINDSAWIPTSFRIGTKIEATYQAVVSFIKWYNQQSQSLKA